MARYSGTEGKYPLKSYLPGNIFYELLYLVKIYHLYACTRDPIEKRPHDLRAQILLFQVPVIVLLTKNANVNLFSFMRAYTLPLIFDNSVC